ncbi:TIGR00282 family metallophosphoesterase [Candidatus Latescibacterota bacterium]
MKVLFVGDIFGRPGKQVASHFIPKFRRERNIDCCIANGENAAGGFGLTETTAHKMFSYGVDIITSGNHIWDRKEVETILEASDRILRPANYPPGVPGNGFTVIERGGYPIGVINLMGRIFLPPIDCPFRAADEVIAQIREMTSIILIDFHAEGTSEKIALGWYLDGRVSAVIGTHTHVMTADERILPNGTAYISDVGMTGPHDSVIGVRIDQSITRIMTHMPVKFSPAEENLKFNAVMVDIDEESGRARSIERIIESYHE